MTNSTHLNTLQRTCMDESERRGVNNLVGGAAREKEGWRRQMEQWRTRPQRREDVETMGVGFRLRGSVWNGSLATN